MESIRPLRPEDKGRTAEIYVFNNRLNYYPIFHDDDYSFGEMQVIPVAENFAHWIGQEDETFVLDDGVIRGLAVVGGGELHSREKVSSDMAKIKYGFSLPVPPSLSSMAMP